LLKFAPRRLTPKRDTSLFAVERFLRVKTQLPLISEIFSEKEQTVIRRKISRACDRQRLAPLRLEL
jgi:hypothetical protein